MPDASFFTALFFVSDEGCFLNNEAFLCIIETQQKERLYSARQTKDGTEMI